jgi:plasmid maintenance system killer protein
MSKSCAAFWHASTLRQCRRTLIYRDTDSIRSGDLKGFWAVTVQANWRVTFRLASGHALEADYVDYR